MFNRSIAFFMISCMFAIVNNSAQGTTPKNSTRNLENTIKEASKKLKNNNINSHVLDAQIILADIMGLKRESLIINDKINISEDVLKKYNIAIKRRINNEPIAYITGKKEFWSQDFFTNRATLVPRPETELLIYKLVDIFKNKKINILDIGTGSGCILLAILKELHIFAWYWYRYFNLKL